MSGEPQASTSSAAEVLAATEPTLRAGIACIQRREYERAVTILEDVVQQRESCFGGTALECGTAFYYYGLALLNHASETRAQGALFEATEAVKAASSGAASDPRQGAAGPSNGVVAGPSSLPTSGLAKPSQVTGQGASDDARSEEGGVEEEHEGQQGEEQAGQLDNGEGQEEEEEEQEEEQEEGEDEDVDDLQVAWEMLEVAKVIFAKEEARQPSILSDVHLALGDVQIENGMFADALNEFEKALEYRRQVAGASHRALSEVLFKMCTCSELACDYGEALLRCNQALDELRAELTLQRSGKANVEATEEESHKEIEEIRGLIKDLEERADELQVSADEDKAAREAMKALLQPILAQHMASGSATAGQTSSAPGDPPKAAKTNVDQGGVQDIGIVGRGKSRITLEPSLPAAPQNGLEPASGSLPASATKRPLDAAHDVGDIADNGAPSSIPPVKRMKKESSEAAPP